jgi:hypothetical protein
MIFFIKILVEIVHLTKKKITKTIYLYTILEWNIFMRINNQIKIIIFIN